VAKDFSWKKLIRTIANAIIGPLWSLGFYSSFYGFSIRRWKLITETRFKRSEQ